MGVPDDEAIRAGRELASTGRSAGGEFLREQLCMLPVNCHCVRNLRTKKIVALLPDTGERYLSTELFAFDAYPLD